MERSTEDERQQDGQNKKKYLTGSLDRLRPRIGRMAACKKVLRKSTRVWRRQAVHQRKEWLTISEETKRLARSSYAGRKTQKNLSALLSR